MNLNDEVKKYITKWQTYGESCPNPIPHVSWGNRGRVGDSMPTGDKCVCGGIGFVQPTVVKVVMETLTEPCRGHIANNQYGDVGQYGAIRNIGCLLSDKCNGCEGARRSIRNWESLGEGALAGVIIHLIACDKKFVPFWYTMGAELLYQNECDLIILAAVDKIFFEKLYNRGK